MTKLLIKSKAAMKWMGFAMAVILLAGCSAARPFEHSEIHGLDKLMIPAPKPVDLMDAATLPTLVAGENRPILRVGYRDRLSVIVWGRPDLGSQFPNEGEGKPLISIVQEDGTLLLPFLDPIVVAGLSVSEIREKIKTRYGEIIPSPQVDVQVVEHRSRIVYLEGAVNETGGVFLNDTRMTLGEVIAAVGGIHPKADAAHGFLMREGVRYGLDYRKTQRGFNNLKSILLDDGDRIFFPAGDERVMYVFGEVYNQGVIPIPDKGMTVLEALAVVGGPFQMTANVNRIFLVRPDDDHLTVYRLGLTELMEHPDIEVMPGDRLLIPPTSLAVWERTWQQMLPFFSAGGTGAIFYRNTSR